MRALRAVLRLAGAFVHALRGLLTILLVFPRLDAAQRESRVQAWAARMLEILGISVEVRGTRPLHGPLLLVANHISWLDILVLHAARHCRFVSKADVRRWPLLGTLATGAGTLYIERESRRDAMRVVHHMAEALRTGDVLAVFPEGTTTDGSQLLPFHGNLLQAAIAADAPVLPVALVYLDARTGQRSRSVAYVGDDTLLASLWRTLAGPRVLARVQYGAAQGAAGRDRRTWAADLHAAVERLRRAAG